MAKLDRIDLRILSEMQRDAGLPLAELARRAALSQTACWRRLQKLDSTGYIRARVALLDRHRLGAGATVFIAVKAAHLSPETLQRFHAAIEGLPEVVEFYRMSNEVDYLLKAYVRDIAAYDALYKKLVARIELRDVTSMFAVEELKSTTAIPLDLERK